MIGIYKIENLKNGKCYIGQSRNIKKRWEEHKNEAFNQKSKGYNYPLYKAFRKYGINNFSFEILEECLIKELNEKEIFWISKFNSFFKGYNQTFGGDTSISTSKEQVIGIIRDLENTQMYHKEIAAKWKVSIETVQGINTGRYWRYDRVYPIQDRYSYLARQKGVEKYIPISKYYCIDCGKEISRKATRCELCQQKFQTIPLEKMPVTREELKQLIRTTSFTSIGKIYNVSDNTIRKWCDKFNLPRRKKDVKSYSNEEWENI